MQQNKFRVQILTRGSTRSQSRASNENFEHSKIYKLILNPILNIVKYISLF